MERRARRLLAATGWARTLGGIDVYLAVRARKPAMKRAELDGAVRDGEVQVVPAVRNCIYLLPRADVPLALAIAAEQYAKRAEREHKLAGIKPGEIDKLGKAVVAALKKGPLTTDGLRKALPEGAVRPLGAAGKKMGLSSPLPPALRELEFSGAVTRVPENNRLDTDAKIRERAAAVWGLNSGAK